MDIPIPDSLHDIADWVEFHLSSSNETISKLQLSRYIEASSGVEPEEGFIHSVWLELIDRLTLYSFSPYLVENSLIKPMNNWMNYPAYMVCLIFSVLGGTQNLFRSSKLFERISAEAYNKYLGSDHLIIGWPNKPKENQSLKEQMEEIALRLKEKFFEPPLAEKKDDTVDIVAWKQFEDERNNQLILLAQCASGRNWDTKVTSLRYTRWCQYIHWACAPIKGFTVPRIIPRRRWHDVSVDSGLLLDRVRICNLLRNNISKKFKNELIVWCQTQLDMLAN